MSETLSLDIKSEMLRINRLFEEAFVEAMKVTSSSGVVPRCDGAIALAGVVGYLKDLEDEFTFLEGKMS